MQLVGGESFAPVVHRAHRLVELLLFEQLRDSFGHGTDAGGADLRRDDRVGQFPVLVTADPNTKAVHTYLRQVGTEELDFLLQDGQLLDRQTGSAWDLARGIALEGPLRGEVLQRVPYVTAYDWAWEDFYPHSTFYPG